MKKIFSDKRILFVYFIVILLLIMGTTFALQSTSLGFNVNTSIVKVDETAYGSTTFDSSNLDFRPILDTNVESSTDNVISIDFKVGGNEQNNNNNIIYDIALTDLELNCDLLSPYLKWKLIKNGMEISNGSLDYQFDTIVDGRLVLTTIQQDLPDYSADEVGYDEYQFYLWLSDSCQSEDVSTCISESDMVDQSSLIGKNLSGKVEVELYTEGKKELVRNPKSSLDATTCQEKYLVEFNYEGGSGSLTSKYVTNGTLYGTLPTPSRDTLTVSYDTGEAASLVSNTIHYTFDGWYLSNQFKPEELVTEDTTVTKTINHKLYAKWSGDEEITLPSPTWSGYVFKGWYSDSELTNKVGNGGDKYLVTESLTLYAKWEINIITLTLNDNGGSGGSGTIYLKYGEDYCSDSDCQNTITSISIPTRTGYVFNGYDGLSDASGTITASTTKYNSNITIPAKWNANTYTISYNLNGGSSGANAPTSGTYAQDVQITNPTKQVTVTLASVEGVTLGSTSVSANQTFAGWTSSSTDGLNTDTAKVGTSANPTTTWSGSATKSNYFRNLRSVSGTVTMTANWTAVSITLPTATRTGYTCKFNTSSDGSGTDYNSGGTYTPSANGGTSVTLYPVCTANTYTVKFNGNGSTSGTTASKTCTYDQDCVLTSNGFSKTGYSFNGWAISSTGDKVYDNGATVNNLVTSGTYNLYATWAANSYTIAYTLNGGTSGTNAPTSGTYDQDVEITNPTKTITVTGNANGTGATVGTTSGVQEFSGWTSGSSAGLDTTNAETTSASLTTSWTGSTTKNENFKNLRSTSGTVTMTANWTPVSFSLPTVSKTGNTCNWNTNSSGTGTSYESGETYTPTSTTAASITLYAQCTPNTYTMTYMSNEISNSDFSDGARDWIFNTFGYLDTSMKYNGMNSVRVTTTSNGWDGIRSSYHVTYKANTRYRVSVKAYRDSSSSYGDLTRTFRVYIPELKSDGSVLDYHAPLGISTSNLPDKTWTEFSFEFTTSASEGTDFSYFNLDFYATDGTSTIWIADPKIEEVHTETKTYGTAFGTLPSVTKTNHTLDGWYTEEDGGGSKITTSSAVPAEDTTYYANWNLAQYTLTVNPNGGTYNGSTGTTTHTQNYDSTRSIVNPTVPAAYTVTYNANGGSVSTTSATTNKIFQGWNLSGSGQYITGSSPSSMSSPITRTPGTDSGGSYEKFSYSVSAPTGNTWYAIQYPSYGYSSGHTYDVRLKFNVTSMSTTGLELRHSAFSNDYGTTGRVKRDFSATTGGYQPIVMSRTYNGTTLTLSGTEKTIAPLFEIYTWNLLNKTDSVTFYVRDMSIVDRNSNSIMQANSNTYWYRGNGTLTASYSSSTSVTLPTPTRTGYTFNGWYTAASGGTKVSSPYTPTASITLYAHWTANYLYNKSVGDYVKYTGNNGCSGNYCSGATQVCYKEGYSFTSSGWRILKKASNTVYLISAGSPECVCTNSNGSIGSGPITKCSSNDTTGGVTKHVANLKKLSLKYCNTTYVYGGSCAATVADDTVHSFTAAEIGALIGKTISPDSECYNNSASGCGQGNTFIDVGGYYWVNGGISSTRTYPLFWSPMYKYYGSSTTVDPRGVRPVIRLKTNVLVTGGAGTSASPWTITVG